MYRFSYNQEEDMLEKSSKNNLIAFTALARGWHFSFVLTFTQCPSVSIQVIQLNQIKTDK